MMKKVGKALVAIAPLSLFSGAASAALDPAIALAFTEVQTDGLALIGLAWPVVIAITVGLIMMGLFKKTAKKAAS